MRPLTLNRLSSAISNTLPQSGQFGRLKSSVATTRVDGLVYADGKFIVDPPRRFALRTHLDAILRGPCGGSATAS
jgi:hypothetical protein